MKANRFLPLFLLLLLFFSACGTSAPAVTPDQLHLVRPALGPHDGSSIDKVITNQSLIHQLYEKLEALPTVPLFNPFQACPAIAGQHDQLTFLQKGKIVLQATADRSGCGTVKIGDNDMRQPDEEFWSLLSQTESAK